VATLHKHYIEESAPEVIRRHGTVQGPATEISSTFVYWFFLAVLYVARAAVVALAYIIAYAYIGVRALWRRARGSTPHL
jgi:hypothetical protein